MRRTSWILFLVAILLPMIGLAAAADPTTLNTQVLTASPTHTEVEAEFDQATLSARLSSLEFGDRPTDGFGMILAIAGHGAPAVTVQSFELGDAVPSALTNVAQADIASSSAELVSVSEPQIIHDLRIVTLGFRPIMRDGAGVLRQVRSIQANVNTLGGSSINEKADPTSFSSAFSSVYRTLVSNLDELYPEYSERTPGRFLVITSASRLASIRGSQYFQNWIDLKQRKGYQVDTLGLANTTFNSVRTAIETAYNDQSQPDLEYVTILGDTNEVATHTATNPENGETSVGDNLYFTLAGNDLLPDVLSGRISGTTAQQYGNYFSKEVGYEVSPYTTDMHWFQSITCVAGNYTDGTTPTYPVTPVWNVEWARERVMRDACITDADTFYYHNTSDPPPGDYSNAIRADIDSGVCAVFYRGWASSQLWQKPIFRNSDVDQLNNVYRTPAVFGIVCGSGNYAFAGGQCLGEEFTTGVGSVTQPKGAIIFFGASDLHTNTRHNNAILAGIVQALMVGGVRSAGALQMAGKLEAWRQFPLEQDGGTNALAYYYILGVFNLLGDPEVQIYFCTPGTLSVDAPTQLTVGQTLVPITVTSDGQPVAGAVVTLRFAGSGAVTAQRTDGAGHAYLPADFPQTGTAQLTVWKSMYFMQRRDIPVGNATFDPKITAVNWINGIQPHPGWPFGYTLSVQNFGSAPATLNATVTSLDPRISITTGTGTFGTLQPGDIGVSPQMGIFLNGGIFNGEHPRLSVVLQDGSNSITREVPVPVIAPEIVINSVRVADGGNGILEAGESNVPVYITGTNLGGMNGSNMHVTVSSWDDAVSFPGTEADWNTLNIGQTGEIPNPFHLSLANQVTPGRQIVLRFEFRMLDSLVATASYILPTGVVTINTPTGPDAYGYYAYEDIDHGSDGNYAATPNFNWIELEGNGGEAHDVRDDTFFSMALPAQFTYYGQNFSNIWICSNGYFSFEQMTLPEFRNWELPSPIGAPSLVAPFWTDLLGDRTMPNDDTLHYVWTRYDQAQNRFIIEWRTFLRACLQGGQPNNCPATFEAILEYPPSGDGSIVFQYNEITIANRPEWNFVTVGWEDSYHVRGMTLTYADMFPASVDTIRANRAIRITRQTPDSYNAADPRTSTLPKEFALHEAFPNPFNPTTELRFDLAKAGRTTLRIYDMLGREVATLVDEQRAAGTYTVAFNGTDLPSGLYFARLMSGSNTQVRKLMLVK